jgi:hypothetical protein
MLLSIAVQPHNPNRLNTGRNVSILEPH